jgi:hypothetical protein
MSKQAVKKFFEVVGDYGKKSKNPSPVTRERGKICPSFDRQTSK